MQDINFRLPAEWEEQDGIQLTWPHSTEIWGTDHPKVVDLFVRIAKIMISYTKLIIICFKSKIVEIFFTVEEKKSIQFLEIPSNDIWSRDHGFITIYQNNTPVLLNFNFNGWGQKFSSNFDNQINKELIKENVLKKDISVKHVPLIFEGGSIDSNGKGYALTTADCIYSKNRNEHIERRELLKKIKALFGLEKLIVLNHGFLAGDDTDSHVDMLARFISHNTIVFASCNDEKDIHFKELQLLKKELETLIDSKNKPYKLIPLPIGKVINDEGKRLPASYVNFLIINKVVLVPQYNVPEDKEALKNFKTFFSKRDVIGIDCSLLIKQGGSLHCATMNFYKGTF